MKKNKDLPRHFFHKLRRLIAMATVEDQIAQTLKIVKSLDKRMTALETTGVKTDNTDVDARLDKLQGNFAETDPADDEDDADTTTTVTGKAATDTSDVGAGAAVNSMDSANVHVQGITSAQASLKNPGAGPMPVPSATDIAAQLANAGVAGTPAGNPATSTVGGSAGLAGPDGHTGSSATAGAGNLDTAVPDAVIAPATANTTYVGATPDNTVQVDHEPDAGASTVAAPDGAMSLEKVDNVPADQA